jgi:hypothetical protein
MSLMPTGQGKQELGSIGEGLRRKKFHHKKRQELLWLSVSWSLRVQML